jgi:hypothetical protein
LERQTEIVLIGKKETQISEGEWRDTAGSLKVAVLPGRSGVEAGRRAFATGSRLLLEQSLGFLGVSRCC